MIDLHIHTTASDGKADLATVRRRLAERPDLRLVAVADHDTTVASEQLAASEPRAWVAAELSSRTGSIPTDVLGLNLDPSVRELRDYLAQRAIERRVRFELFGKALRDRSWIFEPTAAQLSHPNLGQPHVVDELRRHPDNAARLVEMGIAARSGKRDDDSEVFRQVIVPLQITKGGMTLKTTEAVIDLIHAAGGLAVVAHPWIHPYENGKRKTKGRLLVGAWKAMHGLDGLELWHHDQTELHIEQLIRSEAAAVNLLVTAGSDDHSANLDNLGTPTPPAAEAEAVLESLLVAARARRGK